MQEGHSESGYPLYKQLIERIKYYILSGKLAIEQKLAPPKTLAQLLQINKNTIIAAYKQLESEGFLMTRNGQGTYVAGMPEKWQDKKACKELIQIAEDAQQRALGLGFSQEDWCMVVFNQTILEKTIPSSITINWEASEPKKNFKHMLFIADSSEPLEKVAKELRSAFQFFLPLEVCSIDDLPELINDELVTSAYYIFTLEPLVKTVEAILEPARRKVIGLPYWLKSEYPWQ